MQEFPYILTVTTTVFNLGPRITETMRKATPNEAEHYHKMMVAQMNDYGPKLMEYTLKKGNRKPKERLKKYRLGRILKLKNGTSIVFHKESKWRIEFLDAKGFVLSRCKRNEKQDAIRKKIKTYIENSYPEYMDGNFADRVTDTILRGFGHVWLDFVEISKAYLKPLCSTEEEPDFFWDLGDLLFFYRSELPYYANKNSGVCHRKYQQYAFTLNSEIEKMQSQWQSLLKKFQNKEISLVEQPFKLIDDDSINTCLEIVYIAPSGGIAL